MKQRIITGLIFVAVSILFILFSDLSRKIYVHAALVLSMLEYLRLIFPKKKYINLMGLVIYLTVNVGLAYNFGPSSAILLWLNLIAATIYLFSLKMDKVLGMHKKIWPIFVFIIFALNAGLFARLIDDFSANYLLWITIFVWVSDTAAFFIGSRIGKRKLAPRISPKKTWEGFLGAGLVIAILSYVVSSIWFKDLNYQLILLLALSCWLFGSLGDLVQSHIKRSVEIKDSGSILPGHGGFYDRFDGFLYCLPFACMIIYYFIENSL